MEIDLMGDVGGENRLPRYDAFLGQALSINFALGVATGLTMEFQFGTNWSPYSNYVGAIFSLPLAMEALLAFFSNPP